MSYPGQIFRVAFVKKTSRGSKPIADIQGGKTTCIDPSTGSINPDTIRDNTRSGKIYAPLSLIRV